MPLTILRCRRRKPLTMTAYSGRPTLRAQWWFEPPAPSPAAPTACGPAGAPTACTTMGRKSCQDMCERCCTRCPQIETGYRDTTPAASPAAPTACAFSSGCQPAQPLLVLLAHALQRCPLQHVQGSSSNRRCTRPKMYQTEQLRQPTRPWKKRLSRGNGRSTLETQAGCRREPQQCGPQSQNVRAPILGALRPAGLDERPVARRQLFGQRRPHALVHHIVHHLCRQGLRFIFGRQGKRLESIRRALKGIAARK